MILNTKTYHLINMQKLIYKGAINPLSFGNVSYNILREIYKKNTNSFPIGDKLNLDSFDKIDQDFKDWLTNSARNRLHSIDKDSKCITQWHINGGETRISRHQALFTFYETDEPTLAEQSIVNMQDQCIFASSHAAKCFQDVGCENVNHVPIGFDEDFQVLMKSICQIKFISD